VAVQAQASAAVTRNARATGVMTTPSGLQYKVLAPVSAARRERFGRGFSRSLLHRLDDCGAACSRHGSR
jgi:hypothetical protein